MEQKEKSLKSLKKFFFAIVSVVEVGLIWLIAWILAAFINFRVLGIDGENVSTDNEMISVFVGLFFMAVMSGAVFLGYKTYEKLEEKYC